ncbi:MAG: DUF542 domain-containing protein [Lacunisphaera sp.]
MIAPIRALTCGSRPDTTVGTIVAAHPALARFFEHLGLDFCCGGRQPLRHPAVHSARFS